eukprot:TRINITY_DN10135_c0_g1_i1.p1 TRINITY_DN10135_c0_g1~~TRINITY_DN10135_c0_g1_i1.p1  ORF type:complete len:158 (-),score=23.79 TRINITY_DN10135_c0_g1_i1:192-599(-)
MKHTTSLFVLFLGLLAVALVSAHDVPEGNTCSACGDQSEFIQQCQNDGGTWCPCGPLTPPSLCGSCYDINGSGGVCDNGLCCGAGEYACVGAYGAECYGAYSNCECDNGKLNCDYENDAGKPEENSDKSIWRTTA